MVLTQASEPRNLAGLETAFLAKARNIVLILCVNLSFFSKPSRYIDQEVNAIHKAFPTEDARRNAVRVALSFPDIYEIGMSHLGLRILYKTINDLPFAVAERVFAPWGDMAQYLRERGEPLRSLETGTRLCDFDIVGFSLQYELSYTTVLDMLDLGGIPVRREHRDARAPLIIAGGPCTVNPMPLYDFIDAFVIGDGEETASEILHVYQGLRSSKEAVLRELARLPGVFVPDYSHEPVKRVFVRDLDRAPFPTSPVVPYTKTVHDRINIEVSRGCTMGCRFCQAGMIYRPVRERSPDTIIDLAEKSLCSTGYDEVSFTSLSAGDYSQMVPLLRGFNRKFSDQRIALSLPSLRVGAVNDEVLGEIKAVRKSGFTIAPEAATDRLRCVINKDFRESEYDAALNSLFRAGWQTIKLYFMIGLPTEEFGDVKAIVDMARKAQHIASRVGQGRININVGISPFVPKPHTPFQWTGQEPTESLVEKKFHVLRALSKRVFTVKSHNETMSLLEAAVARGDRALGNVIEAAWREGARLEGWSECFDLSRWERAMERTGIAIESYARGSLSSNDPLPWDVVDIGVSKTFLFREYQNALALRKTSNCSERCHACGLQCSSGEFLATGEHRAGRERPAFVPPRFSPVKVRVKYSKGGALRFLSHLELMGALERGLRRAGVPLSYSAGYHPAPKLSFGPALGVGIEGDDEYFDMEVHPPFDIERFKGKIGEGLPEGLSIREMIFVGHTLPSLSSFINCHEYTFEFGGPDPIRGFLSGVPAETRYLPMIVKTEVVNEQMIRVAVQESETKKIRVAELLTELFGVEAESVRIKRTAQWGGGAKMISPMDPAALTHNDRAARQRVEGKRHRTRIRSRIDVK